MEKSDFLCPLFLTSGAAYLKLHVTLFWKISYYLLELELSSYDCLRRLSVSLLAFWQQKKGGPCYLWPGVMTSLDNSPDTFVDVSLGEDEPIPGKSGTELFDGSEQPSGMNLAEAPARESLQLQTAREEEQLPSASDQKTHKAEKR